jgi:hypothetical protein
MLSKKCSQKAFFFGMIISFLIISACTSAASTNYTRYAGTYAAVNDPDHAILQLNSNGTAIGSSDRMPSIIHNYSVQNTTITICAKDPDRCGTGTINDDGSISMGNIRFRKS